MRPDRCYVASDAGNVNTSNNIAIVIAGCALRSVVIDRMIADDATALPANRIICSLGAFGTTKVNDC
jgi:hypothetical protein